MALDLLTSILRPVRFRGKARLLSALAPRSGERSAIVFGYRMKLDVSDFVSRMIYLGAFEQRETSIVLRHLRPGMTFVDIGANVGYFTLLAASRVGPTGRVFAVEPSPAAFAQLKATIEENRLTHVRAFPIGLGAESGEINLYVPPTDFHNHSPSMVANPNSEPVLVPLRRLDDCLDEWGVEAVDLLKIDVEGFEPFVYRGATASLRSGRIRAILCEFNDYWLRQVGSSPMALFQTLTEAGFAPRHDPRPFRPRCVENVFFEYSGR